MAVKPEIFKANAANSKASAMLHVDSVEEVKKICLLNNYDIAVDIRSFPWGTKEIVVRDPDKFILVFIEQTKS